MSTSVGTKAKKKQSPSPVLVVPDRKFESALLTLENTCLSVLDSQFADNRQDTEGLYWQQVFINIATPISLALMESKGPRHFHYHYRHRPENESVLHPVLEDPVDMLAQVCKDALKQCQTHLVGISDRSIVKSGQILERALQSFLLSYKAYRGKK